MRYNYYKKSMFIGLIFLFAGGQIAAEDRWDWDTVNLNDDVFWSKLDFPSNFGWGIATGSWQMEGSQTHNGYVENSYTIHKPERKNNPMFGHWNKYQEDAQLIKQAGFNQYRLHIPWEKIEPEEGIFDEIAMAHYIDEVNKLKRNGVEPMVNLFHFKLPVWFYKKGGFEFEKNNYYFVRFCTYVFDRLHTDVRFWMTYNEPVAYALEAYFRGNKPPYETGVWNLVNKTGVVIANMLKSHCAFYDHAKSVDFDVQIGFTKMFVLLDPYSDTYVEKFICSAGNYLTFGAFLNFFKTGTFTWFGRNLYTKNEKSLNFIGINYYRHEIVRSRYLYDFKRLLSRDNEQTVPETGKSIYPEGLYRSIQIASALGIPMYITENGVATRDEPLWNEFTKKHLYALQKALRDGYDVRGYHYWTFLDLTSCPAPYGLHLVDEKTGKKSLRSGALNFSSFLLNR